MTNNQLEAIARSSMKKHGIVGDKLNEWAAIIVADVLADRAAFEEAYQTTDIETIVQQVASDCVEN